MPCASSLIVTRMPEAALYARPVAAGAVAAQQVRLDQVLHIGEAAHLFAVAEHDRVLALR